MSASGDKFQITTSPDRYTRPPRRVWHIVTDDDLDALRQSSGDAYFHMALMTAGVSIGFSRDFYMCLLDIINERLPSPADFLSAFVCVVMITSTLCFCIIKKGHPSTRSLVARIKGRRTYVVEKSATSTGPQFSEANALMEKADRADPVNSSRLSTGH